MVTSMRKPSEIIALAVADPRYKPMNAGFDENSFEYLCLLLSYMARHSEITEAECSAARYVINKAIRPYSTLSGYMAINYGYAYLNRQQFMHFWDQLIQKLQAKGR